MVDKAKKYKDLKVENICLTHVDVEEGQIDRCMSRKYVLCKWVSINRLRLIGRVFCGI